MFYNSSVTLRQLRFLREIARQSLNISNAAAALHTSQPGVSRQVRLLERELGVDLLVRRKNRVLGFTDTGRAVLGVAQKLLNEADNIRLIAEDARNEGGGRLVVATSHLHARYTLRGTVKAFSRRHPEVQLQLLQIEADNIFRMVETGEADIGISTELGGRRPLLTLLQGDVVRRSVIMPKGHPLARKRGLTLADIARYPIVGYSPRSRAGQIVGETFRRNGLALRYAVSANDADVIKTYVGEGLGIAIVPSLAIDKADARAIHTADATHLFPHSLMTVSLRRDTYLRRYLTDFVEMVAPAWSRKEIRRAMNAPDVLEADGIARG